MRKFMPTGVDCFVLIIVNGLPEPFVSDKCTIKTVHVFFYGNRQHRTYWQHHSSEVARAGSIGSLAGKANPVHPQQCLQDYAEAAYQHRPSAANLQNPGLQFLQLLRLSDRRHSHTGSQNG